MALPVVLECTEFEARMLLTLFGAKPWHSDGYLYNGTAHTDGRRWFDLDQTEALRSICSGGYVHQRFADALEDLRGS